MSHVQKLQLNAAAPVLSLTLGAALAAGRGVSAPMAALASLFLFSCVLVGLAQQTLP